MAKEQSQFQLIWGLMLAAMGIALLYRIPQVMPRITEIEQFAYIRPFLNFCFYLMACILIAGGCRKIYLHIKPRIKP